MSSTRRFLACALVSAAFGCSYGSTGMSADGGAAGSNGGGAVAIGGTDALGGSEAGTAGGGSVAGWFGSAGGTAANCEAPVLADLRVYTGASWDALGYPPYALDGCTLVYVAASDSGGALRLRNLSSGDDILLEAAELAPRRPAISGDVIAWEAGEGNNSEIRVHYRGQTRTLSGAFARAAEPRVSADAVVFTAFMGVENSSDTDVYLYHVATGQLAPVVTGPGQQRFADVSLTHVALTDFSEDPAGHFDGLGSIADVVVVDRGTGQAVPRQAPGKQAFPLLASDGTVVYLHWGSVHPEPKFSQFYIKAGDPAEPVELDVDLKGELVRTDPAYVRPSLHGVLVDFVDTQASVVGLYRVSLADLQPPLARSVPGGPGRLFGPVSSTAFTLVSRPDEQQTLAIVTVER